MSLNYWCQFNILTGISIDPRYDLGITDIFDNELSISHSCSESFKESKWVLVTVNNYIVEEVLDEKPIFEFVSSDEINKTIKENKLKNQTKNQKVVNVTYEKPSELFLSSTNWSFINSTMDLKKYPLLIGPKGCGKTQTAYSIAKARGMKFYTINCGAIFKPKQTLVGQMQAKEGTTYLLSSEFLRYFTDESEEGVMIFLDEISRIPPAAANYFMTILDRIQSYIYVEEEARQVKRGKNVVFFAAANFGYEYTDTRNLDGALIDRFMKFLIDYLPEDQEAELIKQRVPLANIKDIAKLVSYATLFRKQNDKIRVSISTRQLIDMAEYLPLGYDLKSIFYNIFLNLFVNGSMDERETVRKMMDSKI